MRLLFVIMYTCALGGCGLFQKKPEEPAPVESAPPVEEVPTEQPQNIPETRIEVVETPREEASSLVIPEGLEKVLQEVLLVARLAELNERIAEGDRVREETLTKLRRNFARKMQKERLKKAEALATFHERLRALSGEEEK